MEAPNELMFRLIQRLEKNNHIAAISPKVMFANKPKIIWFGGTKIGNNLKLQENVQIIFVKKKDSNEFRGLINTDAFVGCASVMRSKYLEKNWTFQVRFFLWRGRY